MHLMVSALCILVYISTPIAVRRMVSEVTRRMMDESNIPIIAWKLAEYGIQIN
ncbi:hypothetical protein RUND412_010506, partial [Rhizina undulata]